MSHISELILQLIQDQGVSYGELAKATGIPKSALQRYATGDTAKIPMDRVELIAKALHTTAAYLMGWADTSTPVSDGIQLSDIQFALMSESKDLTDEQLQEVLNFARFVAQNKKKET